MRVRNLELNNVRQFGHKRLDFVPGFNLLIGENGAGKSTVLRSLLTTLGHAGNFKPANRLGDDDIRYRAHDFHVRLEYQIGEEMSMLEIRRRWREKTKRSGKLGKHPIIWFGPNESSPRTLQGKKTRHYPRSESEKHRKSDDFWLREEFLFEAEFMDADDDDGQPEFGHSEVVRRFVGKMLSEFSSKFERFVWRFMPFDCVVQIQQPDSLDPKKLAAFRDEARAEVMRHLEYNESSRRYRRGWGNKRSITFNMKGYPIDERKRVRPLHELDHLLRGAAQRAKISELPSGITVQLKLAPRIYVLGRDGPFLLNQLSDGEKRIFSMIVDIARQLSLAAGGWKELELAPGLVVIDEIDCHLHPKWQRMIVHALETLFPACQFIASTHSPFVIQGIEENQLHSLGTETQPEFTDRGIEEIAFKVMDVKDQEVSPRYYELLNVAKQYYTLVEEAGNTHGAKRRELAKRLKELSGKYARNPAFQAYLEMKGQGRLGNNLEP